VARVREISASFITQNSIAVVLGMPLELKKKIRCRLDFLIALKHT